jgi:4'-phosphopantetheinyl transferase
MLRAGSGQSSAVQVWSIHTADPPQSERELRSLLTPAEQQRVDGYQRAVDRTMALVSRGALRLLLGEWLDCAPAELVFVRSARGRPVVCAAGAPSFSVSHSGAWVLVALSRAADIGVDVEQVRRLSDMDAVAAHCFAPSERAALRRLAPHEREAAFFRCWTRKEALVKALGTGLGTPLHTFAVSMAPDERPALVGTDEHCAVSGPWTLADVAPASGYAAAIAVRSADVGIDLRRWSSDRR